MNYANNINAYNEEELDFTRWRIGVIVAELGFEIFKGLLRSLEALALSVFYCTD